MGNRQPASQRYRATSQPTGSCALDIDIELHTRIYIGTEHKAKWLDIYTFV